MPRKQIKWSKEKIIREIKKRNKNGLPLNCNAVVKDNRNLLVSAVRYFGKWKNAVNTAGINYLDIKLGDSIKEKRQQTPHRKKMTIEKIQKRNQCGLSLFAFRVQEQDPALYYRVIRYFGNWSSALIKAGFDANKIKQDAQKEKARKRIKWTKKRVLDGIEERKKKRLALNSGAVQKDCAMLVSAARKLFGNWDEALKSLNLDPFAIKLSDKWTKERIIEEIQKKYKQKENLSRKLVMKKDRKFVGITCFYFGSWGNAIRAAGIDYSKVRLNRIFSLEDMKSVAQSRGGKCLSNHYNETRDKLWWQCKNGHRWKATVSSVVYSKTWCPYCKFNLNEEKCRYIFEWLTGKDFPKNNKVLQNGQELDGYCEDLNLAFEHNGEQHYLSSHPFHKTKEDFLQQKNWDLRKKQKCKKIGIKLIVIPHHVFKKNNELTFISNRLKKHKIKIVQNISFFSYAGFSRKDKIDICREFVKKKNGKLISEFYLDSKTKMKWQCEKGHTWEAGWSSIKAGHWCPECSGSKKKTIEEMQFIAKQKGLECLSIVYTNSYTRLTWKCLCCKQIVKLIPQAVKQQKGKNGCRSCNMKKNKNG